MCSNGFPVSGVFTAHQTRPSDNAKLPILSLVPLNCRDGWKVLYTLGCQKSYFAYLDRARKGALFHADVIVYIFAHLDAALCTEGNKLDMN